MQNPTHILVVDDDTRIRDLLGKFLKDRDYFVTAAKDAFEAEEKLQEFIFDLIIVDVMMPGKSGVEFTENLRKTNQTPVLMLTAMGEVEDRITGLQSGADDYLAKPFEAQELLLRVQNIIQRTKKQDKLKSITFGKVTFNPENNSLSDKNGAISITSNEAKLINILCRNPGKTVSREDLAKLSGGINERSIDVQITRLRNKIEQDPKKPIYLKTVRGQGYVLYPQ